MISEKILLSFLLILLFSRTNGQQTEQKEDFRNSFVQVSRKNTLYFDLSNGETYIPVGANICWARDLETLLTYFEKLAENGGNYARIWLNFPNHEIEPAIGLVDENNFRNIDRILETASKHNIKVKLCIESFRQINTGNGFFNKPHYHKANGGLFSNMDEYIQSGEGRQVYLNRLEQFRKRYGSHPAVFGWELWNEMNAIEASGLWEWNEYMLPRVHDMFPENLVMQSLGSFDHEGARKDYRYINRMKSNDIAQIHRYLDLGAQLDICKAPMDVLAAGSIEELRSYEVHKPMLLAEAGGVKPKHTGPIEIYELDEDGILLHDILFAPFFSGAAGPGHAWHWDNYIDKNDLWYHFRRFSEVIKDIDPVQENFIPLKMYHPNLRIYVLQGKKTVILWCRDASNDWENEFIRQNKPAVLSRLTLDVSSLLNRKSIRKISVYDPWENQWTERLTDPEIILPDFKRSLVIRIEKK